MSQLVRLRRNDTGTPWGFRMNGGAEYGQPLYVFKIVPGSIGFKHGLRPGDAILQIGSVPTSGMRHDQAKMEIIRAGNEVDFIVQRNVVRIPEPQAQQTSPEPQTQSSPGPRIEIVEEASQWHAQNPNVQSRSFKLLQASLEAEQMPGS